MAVVGFQHEPVSLDVNEDCFEEEHRISLIHVKNQRKVTALLNNVDVGNETMYTNFEYLSCGEVEVWDTFNHRI